ncbi:MAG: hypothetical protein MEBIL_04008 [Bilophila sp.]
MSRQKLSLAEQETIILWDNGTGTAEVYTHDARLTGKLRELSQRFPEAFVLKRSGPGRSVTYQIPKRCVGIRPPYSEERRQQQRQDAKEHGLPFLTKEERNA